MKCQDLYDLREKTEWVNGTDLHEIFRLLVGDPSPSGLDLLPHDWKEQANALPVWLKGAKMIELIEANSIIG